jgi:ABC-2 type transport system permease protein
MSWGTHPLWLIPIVLGTSLAATSLGLLVATIVRTDQQVSSYTHLVVTSLAGLSGCFLPRDWMPEVMKQVSLATPHAWSLIAYAEALTNPQPASSVIALHCLGLLGFSAVFFAAGSWRFRGLQ